MRTTFQFILTEVLVLIMLCSGTFPTWAKIAIVLIVAVQFIELTIRAVKRFKADKQA
jgi:hypothetical protein